MMVCNSSCGEGEEAGLMARQKKEGILAVEMERRLVGVAEQALEE